MNILRIALVGNTGVGKSTFVQILKKHFKSNFVKEIRLAKPLYKVQSYIYKICKIQKQHGVQDGVLLNFLGEHMRYINQNVIEDHFIEQLQKVPNKAKIIVCSDVRPIDVEFIKKQNFVLINIQADEAIALKRRVKRGDLSLANSKHSTEQAIYGFQPDQIMVNNKSVEVFENEVLDLVNKLYDFNWQGNRESGFKQSYSHQAFLP